MPHMQVPPNPPSAPLKVSAEGVPLYRACALTCPCAALQASESLLAVPPEVLCREGA